LRALLLNIVILLTCSTQVFATHNRSGSITYRHLFGNTYEFTVTTCTKTSSDADRPELEIVWGDGSSDTIPRVDIIFDAEYDVQINTYLGQHTFTGPDTYIISVEDPNRNAGVLNITSSVDKVFCIQTQLVISPFIGTANNSLIIEDCPCPEYACVGAPWCYNLSAFDPDGDSLVYSLIPCKGEDCIDMAIPGVYQYPHLVAGGIMSIDPTSGTLCWDSPTMAGEFNIAILIQEYRLGFYVGSVIQDMQFVVMNNCDNDPPVIEDVADTCVFAGTTLDIPFNATDSEHSIYVFATGAVFHLPDNPAVFDDSTGFMFSTGRFLWNPTCSEAGADYYTIIVHAQDNHPEIPLTDLSTFRIKVKIPEVTGLTVTPTGNTMTLAWDPSICSDIDHYNIYRSIDSTSDSSDCCAAGTAEAMGYELVGSSTDTNFVDPGPLIVGNEYCYLITAVNANGVESCVSDQICDHLDFEIPVMTHVSVIETATATGKDTVMWSYPKELNTTTFPGPYHYQLYRSPDFSGGSETNVYNSTPQASINNPDTVFFDVVLDTDVRPYTYRVELYSDGLLVGSSLQASSVFLSLIPNDNQLALVWEESKPWTNYQWEIYKETPTGSGTFVFIAAVDTIGYIDTGLVNGADYCYKVRSIGEYTADGIINPILNWSQEACGSPTDLTAPCPPTLFIDGDCDLEETYLSWTNPNNDCADDVTRYNLYFAPFEGDSLELLTSFSSATDTFFVHADRGSIAGCYYVTALDSVLYDNESVPSNIACIDNCDGFYELPNVFTPDASGANDLYHPLLPYKFVEKIDFQVFNRWGDEVFTTHDRDINWDGTDEDTGKQLNDGVYFYAVTVYEIKLAGLVPRSFQGNIQIIHSH
jgi:gliding motility-associated-like protein